MIKYQNGTKDVFKLKESENKNGVNVSSEEVKKNEAIKNLEKYVRNRITGQVIKLEGFRKTNGTMKNVFGQMIYSINFEIDLRFISNGWLKGNGLEGYWRNNFYVYSSKPNLSASGEQYMYGTKLYESGTLVTLGCVAEMKSTDNGFMVESLSIETEKNHGIVSNTITDNTKVVKEIPKTPGYTGDLKDGKKDGNGIEVYPDGSSYDGEWKDDKKNGKGVLRNKIGIYTGTWINDKMNGDFFANIFITKEASTLVSKIIYVGSFKEDNYYNGVMTVTELSGSKVEYKVKDGVMQIFTDEEMKMFKK
jgi:hypothetical protein